MTSFNLDYQNGTESLLSFDSNFVEGNAYTTSNWTISCEAYFTRISGDTTSPNSGSTYVIGGKAGSQMLQMAKDRATNLIVILKTDNMIQRGNVLISSFSMSSSAGSVLTYQLELKGNSALTTVSS